MVSYGLNICKITYGNIFYQNSLDYNKLLYICSEIPLKTINAMKIVIAIVITVFFLRAIYKASRKSCTWTDDEWAQLDEDLVDV